jgi:flagellar assembly protein FliH
MKRKLSAGDLKSSNQKIVIGGLNPDEYNGLMTKEQIMQERFAEAEAEFKARAHQLTAEAEAEAESLLQRAETDIQQARARAEEEGFQQGYQAGETEAKAEIKDLVAHLETLINKLEQEKQTIIKDQEESIVEFVGAFARKILGQELSDPDMLLAAVKQALDKIDLTCNLNLYLNPKYSDYISEKLANYTGLAKVENFKVLESTKLSENDMILENERTRYDFRLDTQVGQMLDSILDELKNPSASYVPKTSLQESEINQLEPENFKQTLDQVQAKRSAQENEIGNNDTDTADKIDKDFQNSTQDITSPANTENSNDQESKPENLVAKSNKDFTAQQEIDMQVGLNQMLMEHETSELSSLAKPAPDNELALDLSKSHGEIASERDHQHVDDNSSATISKAEAKILEDPEDSANNTTAENLNSTKNCNQEEAETPKQPKNVNDSGAFNESYPKSSSDTENSEFEPIDVLDASNMEEFKS